MKSHRTPLAVLASLLLLIVPAWRLTAQDETKAPDKAVKTEPAAAAKAPDKAAKPVDPDREKMNAARKQAMADPAVKAANDAAKKAQMEAQKVTLAKMREIDPSLSARIDQEEAKLKPAERKPMEKKEKATPKPKEG
jgi:hypothetical protein